MPYRGAAPAVTDLISGRVRVIFVPVTSSIAHIKAGELRALAVTATRLDILPDVPPVSDVLPGYQANDFRGIGVPRGTPGEIVDKLNKAINACLADPNIKIRLAELGSVRFQCRRPILGNSLITRLKKWAKVIKFANIKPE